jgi:hypothetical protein
LTYNINNSSDIDVADKCLITGEPLTDYYVTMKCEHKFNYLPLYKDLVNYKHKFSSMEKHHISKNEIRCPYCRIRQNVLPYHEELKLPKVSGVNWIDNTLKTTMLCQYLMPNPNFNLSTDNTNIIEVYDKNTQSDITCCKFLHCEFLGLPMTTYDSSNTPSTCYYCYYHHKQIKKDNQQIKILAAKASAKAAKDSAKIHKEQMKASAKAAKAKCTHILKTGVNKGQTCNKLCDNNEDTIVDSSVKIIVNLCKRHNKLL